MPTPPLLDAHQVGLGHTGNETWARNVVRVLEADGGAPPHYAVTSAGAELLSVPSARRTVVSGSSARRLAWDLPLLVRRLRPSALLVQYTLPPVLHVPGVVAVHDLSFLEPQAREWIPAGSLLRYRSTIGPSVRRAKVVLVPSEHTRAAVVEHYGRDPDDVLVAPLALDPELGRALEAASVRASVPTVLCVGTLLPRKNLPVVARAVASLNASGLGVRLRLVGPVRDAGRTDLALMQDVLGSALEVVGPVSQAQLAHEYASAHVLAFPSLHEGFGLPLLEAMAAGIPVVSSSATCLPEVAGDAAVLVPPLAVEAWTEALRGVLGDADEAARLRAAGHARVAGFTWEATGAVIRRALALAAG